MTETVEAIYENGVLRLVQPLKGITERARVRVTVEIIDEGETVFEFLRRLPPGTRTKEDIDQQIREEHDAGGSHNREALD